MTTIGFIGGTGPEGLGLAMRFALAGHAVRIGSRRQERAEEAAQKVRDALANAGRDADAAGALNAQVAMAADFVMVVVPFEGHAATLTDLRSAIGAKIVVDAAVPLQFQDGIPGATAVPEGSATQQAQAILPDARVVGAFHTLSARKLQDLAHPIEGDVLTTGDDADAKRAVMDLTAQVADLRPVDAGPLVMSRLVEGLTPLILGINRRYKTQAAVQFVSLS